MMRRWPLDVARCAKQENDPLWRMPLWPPYDSWLDSKVAEHQQRAVRRLRRLDHLRAVPAALRRARQELAACRHLRLDAVGKAGAARGRRMPGRARDLQAAERTLWHDPRLTPARGPTSPRNISKARSRPRASSRARRSRSSTRSRRCARAPSADAELMTQALQGRARHDLRPQRRRLGLGPARAATAMSAGCPMRAGEAGAPRRRTRSPRSGRSPFPAPRSSCRRSRRW